MSFEDGAVLGECLKGLDRNTFLKDKHKALAVYESCRIKRTNEIVARETFNKTSIISTMAPSRSRVTRR